MNRPETQRNYLGILILTSLTLTLGVGCLSGFWGFSLGNKSLKALIQPTGQTRRMSRDQNGMFLQQKKLVMLKETDILSSTNVWTQGNACGSSGDFLKQAQNREKQAIQHNSH